jgi:hypothetical protein
MGEAKRRCLKPPPLSLPLEGEGSALEVAFRLAGKCLPLPMWGGDRGGASALTLGPPP